MQVDRISAEVVDAAIKVHRSLGPGLLESVYETILAGYLERSGLRVDRQKPVDIQFDGMTFVGAFRVDLLVERALVVEIKSVGQTAPVHAKQLLTYLRLLNFGHETMKEGIRRVVNDYSDPPNFSASPRLRASA